MIPVPVPEADMVVSLPETLFENLLPDIPAGDEVIMVVTAINTTGDGPGAAGMGKKPKSGESGETIEVASAAVIDLVLVSGTSLNVTDLVDPILFSLPANYSEGMTCAYWDEKDEAWSTDGVGISAQNVPGKNIECATRHLSLFAAIFRGFVNAVQCSQFRLLTAERIGEVAKSAWYTTVGGAVWISTWLVAAVLFLMAALADHRRSRSHPWRDEYFFITEVHEVSGALSEQAHDTADVAVLVHYGSEESEPGHRHNSIILPLLLGCVTACIFLVRQVKAVSGALRDVVDDIMVNHFEYFSEVRTMVEGLCSEITMEAIGNFTLAKATHAAMTHLVHSTAMKVAGAKLKYNADMMECLIKDDHMEHITTALRQGRDAKEHRYQLLADGQKEAWDCLYNEIPAHLDQHITRTFWLELRLMLDLIVGSSPIGTAFNSSIFMSCKQKVFFLLLEFNGALLLSVAFFSASGAVKGKAIAEPTCDVARSAFAEIGRLAALALGSVILSWLPTAMLESLQSRRLVVLPAGSKRKGQILRAWRLQDAAIYLLGGSYLAFTCFFVAVFFANLDAQDSLSMATSTLLAVGQEHIVMPLALGAVVPLMTHVSVWASGMKQEDHARAMRRSFHRRAPTLVADI